MKSLGGYYGLRRVLAKGVVIAGVVAGVAVAVGTVVVVEGIDAVDHGAAAAAAVGEAVEDVVGGLDYYLSGESKA